MSWRDFWNGDHSIYVNERHKLLHYDGIAKDLARLLPKGGPVVLDHGCGEALAADALAAQCGALYLYDAAPNVQGKLRAHFARDERVVVLSTDALEALPDSSLDVVIANSMLQYLARDEFERLLDFWHVKLKRGGRLVIADVIPPDVGPVADVQALLSFAFRGGFLFAAAGGLVKTFFSSYRKLREEIGLTHYAQEDMETLLATHGFSAKRAVDNVGHNPARMTFVAARG